MAEVAPWPFSCGDAVGLFSKLDEQAREEEEGLQEEVDHRVARVDLRQVARDRHSERGRVSCKLGDVRIWSRGLKGAHASQDRTLRLAGTWHAR